MIKKENCLPGNQVTVNNKTLKWDSALGTTNNGLVGFPFNPDGVLKIGSEFEIPIGTKLVILSTPKRFNGSGNQVKFKLEEDPKGVIYSSWWTCFKHKVDK
jgi:hypothetical protein